MIEIPIGKAIVALKSDLQLNQEYGDKDLNWEVECCKGCIFFDDTKRKELEGLTDSETCGCLLCNAESRRDKMNVIFKLVDLLTF